MDDLKKKAEANRRVKAAELKLAEIKRKQKEQAAKTAEAVDKRIQ